MKNFICLAIAMMLLAGCASSKKAVETQGDSQQLVEPFRNDRKIKYMFHTFICQCQE